MAYKPRSHHTSNNVKATLSNTAKSNVASTKSNVALTLGLLPFWWQHVERVFLVKFRPFDKAN